MKRETLVKRYDLISPTRCLITESQRYLKVDSEDMTTYAAYFIIKTDSGIRVIPMTQEVQKAKKEHRKAELLPKVSAHVMRHTACTRMAECRMDIKVLQYIMGHAHIDVTMDVYNHLGDRERIEQEIARLDSMAVNF